MLADTLQFRMEFIRRETPGPGSARDLSCSLYRQQQEVAERFDAAVMRSWPRGERSFSTGRAGALGCVMPASLAMTASSDCLCAADHGSGREGIFAQVCS